MILNPVIWWRRRQRQRLEALAVRVFREAERVLFAEGRLDRYDPWTIHGPAVCEGDACCFHDPSDHHMVEWPLFVRLDRSDVLTERTCPHGIGHPDPDSLAWIEARGGDRVGASVHGCDGCCQVEAFG